MTYPTKPDNAPKPPVIEIRVVGPTKADVEKIVDLLMKNFDYILPSRVIENRVDPGFRCYITILSGKEKL